MPIYAYRCSTCGHAKDVLQKMSDPVLTECPECGASTFLKQLTAAGFQLKGSGWYVTDFRNGDKAPAAKPGDDAQSDAKSGAKADAPQTDSAAPAANGAAKGDAAPAAVAAPAPAPAPAAPKSEGK